MVLRIDEPTWRRVGTIVSVGSADPEIVSATGADVSIDSADMSGIRSVRYPEVDAETSTSPSPAQPRSLVPKNSASGCGVEEHAPPLDDTQLRVLGLEDEIASLSAQVGRSVSVMLYRSVDDIVARGPSIAVPNP